MSFELCPFCGSTQLRLKHVTRTYGKGEELLVVENIPSITCGHCGESYFTAQTMHEIERVKRERKSLAEKRAVEVAVFP